MNKLGKYLAVPVMALSIASNAMCEDRIDSSKNDKPGLAEIVEENKQYDKILKNVQEKRIELSDEYKIADENGKKEVIEKSRDYIFDTLVNDIFPEWYGTKYDFYGQTQVPKNGEIACGHFVSTTLEDVGFKINRQELGDELAGHIINTFTDNIAEYKKRSPKHKAQEDIKTSGKGIYIIGFNKHVGFVVNDGSNIDLVHSSKTNPPEVTSIPLDKYLTKSKFDYKTTGKILDDKMVEKWLNGEHFPAKKNFFQKYAKYRK